jgi:hypothetical protein
MAALGSTTGVDGVKAGGNTPVWIIQEADMDPALTSTSTNFPLSVLSAETTVRADCYLNLDGLGMTRNLETEERQRMCEKVKVKRKTGETIDGTITTVYDQQADADDEINAVYTALPENAQVYIAQAFGWDSDKVPTTDTKFDVHRAKVQQRTKNQPVAGEDLTVTAELSADLYLQDISPEGGVDGGGDGGNDGGSGE